MQMNIKKSIKLGLHLGYFSAKIPPKPNFDEYKIGLYARHPLWAPVLNGVEFLFHFKKLPVFMKTIKNKSNKYSLQQTETSFFQTHQHQPMPCMHSVQTVPQLLT